MPQGASPAEKAAALRDIQAQKIGIQSQIKGLSSQIADLRSQSF
jgi:prefoldin subunit 5